MIARKNTVTAWLTGVKIGLFAREGPLFQTPEMIAKDSAQDTTHQIIPMVWTEFNWVTFSSTKVFASSSNMGAGDEGLTGNHSHKRFRLAIRIKVSLRR